jgi:hypothetical protein
MNNVDELLAGWMAKVVIWASMAVSLLGFLIAKPFKPILELFGGVSSRALKTKQRPEPVITVICQFQWYGKAII